MINVGQVWQSADSRDKDRKVRVVELDMNYAIVENAVGRRTRIKVVDGKLNRYKLVG